MGIGACGKDKVFARRRAGLTLLTILLMLFFLSQLSNPLALGEGAIASETLTLTVYLDGYVLALHELKVNQSYPTVNANLLGQTHENLLIEDERSLPLDYSTANGTAIIYSLGASQIRISYLTQDLTSKTGKLWTLKVKALMNMTVILPEFSSIISLSDVPEVIESSNSQVTLIMQPGEVEVTYVIERELSEQTFAYEAPWELIAVAVLFSIPVLSLAIWILKRKKHPAEEENKESTVDIEKLFGREKDLRQEEIQVIQFLAEKNGTAFEAELYEKLMLPRTTTWRLLKRLEKMEIIDIKKSRRQNIVTIRKKYRKK